MKQVEQTTMSDIELGAMPKQHLLEHIALTIASNPLSDYINDQFNMWDDEEGMEELIADLRIVLQFAHEYQTRILEASE